MVGQMYEEFTRLAETRLARNGLDYNNEVILMHWVSGTRQLSAEAVPNHDTTVGLISEYVLSRNAKGSRKLSRRQAGGKRVINTAISIVTISVISIIIDIISITIITSSINVIPRVMNLH